MALLNRFSRLNDRGETGIFTFIVTKSVTRDFHRDATTKDFCFGYHRWAISFQRPSEKVLGVHLLLRNPSPNTACVVDFTLTLVNRQHFSQNESYTKRQAKFTITNPMQGVARWIQMSDLTERNFSTESGEFLFELALSNMSTIFECDIQLNAAILNQYKSMLKDGAQGRGETPTSKQGSAAGSAAQSGGSSSLSSSSKAKGARNSSELINLETNYFTFGSFDWSLTIVPLVMGQQQQTSSKQYPSQHQSSGSSGSLSASGNRLVPGAPAHPKEHQHQLKLEPVCRVYLNRLSGFESLCRVKYRVILGHHQAGGHQQQEHADSRLLDQISDSSGRIRGYQFRNTNILKLISLRSSLGGGQQGASLQGHHHQQQQQHHYQATSCQQQAGPALDLRVHIEMFCANTVSEARVSLHRKPNELQAWCVEADTESADGVRLKLFFLDLQSVPRNHIRYISWIAYIVRRQANGTARDSVLVRNAPHCNYYLQDGIDMGTIMDTELPVKECYLEAGQLTVHIEWVDSLLLFSHLYNNYDSLATVQRHQIRRELCALQQEFAHLESKYAKVKRALKELSGSAKPSKASSGHPDESHPDLDYSSTGNLSDSLPGPSVHISALTGGGVDESSQESSLPLALSAPINNTADKLTHGCHGKSKLAPEFEQHLLTSSAQQVLPSAVEPANKQSGPVTTNAHANHNLTQMSAISKFGPPTSRIEGWPGQPGEPPVAASSRRRLPQQPIVTSNPGASSSQHQRLLYGRLSQVSLSGPGQSYLTRSSVDLGLDPALSMSPLAMMRRTSGQLALQEQPERSLDMQLRQRDHRYESVDLELVELPESEPPLAPDRYQSRMPLGGQHLAVEPIESELGYRGEPPPTQIPQLHNQPNPELEALHRSAMADRLPEANAHLHLMHHHHHHHHHQQQHHHHQQQHLAQQISASVSPQVGQQSSASQLEQFMMLEQYGSL